MSEMTTQTVRVVGVPMDLGQKRRGVDMGPSAIRYAGLQRRLEGLGLHVHDGGNVRVVQPEQIVDQLDRDPSDGLAHHVDAIVETCRLVHQQARAAFGAGETLVFLGGDHSVSLGTVSAALYCPEPLGVLWVDAHGDFNTPHTTPSGNVHGMVVAALMGRCPSSLAIGDRVLQPSQVVMIGTRDLDADERAALRESGVTVFTMRHIDEQGMARTIREALDVLSDAGVLHVSLDMDSLDPSLAPGVGTPVPGGLDYREAHLLMEVLADDGRVRSLDIVEINPILDQANNTAKVAVELAASLFGQRIL